MTSDLHKKSKENIRILHLPMLIGGNPQGISNHFNEMGLNSETWTFSTNPYGYQPDLILFIETDSFLYREIKRLYALRYIFMFDVVFFNFGSTLFQQVAPKNDKRSPHKKLFLSLYRIYAAAMQKLELTILRFRGVVMLVQYQGDDARQGDYVRDNFKINFIFI